MIVVVGATGALGGGICRRLKARGHSVRALVRTGAHVETLAALGVETVHGDLKAAASLARLCEGASAIISTANTIRSRRAGDTFETVDRDGHVALIHAARGARVPRFVFVSVSATLPPDNAFVRAKRTVERALRSSGLAWTILQPAAFMEVHCGEPLGWDFARARARILGDANLPRAYVSMHDVAHLAATVVDDVRAVDRILPITGPEPLSAGEAVRVMERALQRPVRVQRVPRWALRLMAAGLSPLSQVGSSLLSMSSNARPEVECTRAVEHEFGVRLTPFSDYVLHAISATASRASRAD